MKEKRTRSQQMAGSGKEMGSKATPQEEASPQQRGTLSRRSFLQGASAAALGAASLGLVGCSTGGSGGSESTGSGTGVSDGSDLWAIKELPEPSETIQADVAIVGGGGTGTAAAIQCKQLGLEPFVVDCGSDFAGSFIGTEGMFGVETHWTREAGEDLTVAKAVQQCEIYHHWIPNHELYTNFFSQTAETIEWVEALGVQYADVVALGISDIAWHVYARTDKSSPGHTFMEGLGAAAHDLGVEAEFKAFARRIVMEGGKVAGLLVERDDGKALKIEAPAVILGSGGYSTNEDMIYELSHSENENIFSVGAETRNGDGLIMAKDAGADFAESPGTVMWCGPWIIGAGWGSDGYCASVQPTLWINQDAQRFVNEDLWLDDFAAAGMALRNQKRTYVLFGEKDIDRFTAEGPYGPVFTFGQVGVPMENARTELEDLPTVHIGDDLAALAAEVDIDPDALKKTVEEYNAFCDAGVDSVYLKKPEYLNRVEAPYWLCEIANGYYTTCGGVKVNANVEVVDINGEVIPGLYAGGSDAGGLYGDSYDVCFAPGSQASWAINSGRLAAKNAAKFLGR